MGLAGCYKSASAKDHSMKRPGVARTSRKSPSILKTVGWFLAMLCTLPCASAETAHCVLQTDCNSTRNMIHTVLPMHLNSTHFSQNLSMHTFVHQAWENHVGTANVNPFNDTWNHTPSWFSLSFGTLRKDTQEDSLLDVRFAAILGGCFTFLSFAASPTRRQKRRKKHPGLVTIAKPVVRKPMWPARVCKHRRVKHARVKARRFAMRCWRKRVKPFAITHTHDKHM